MNLHEYQAKELLAKYGVRVQTGIVAFSAEEAMNAYDKLGNSCAVVKAQIHAGGRGKAGGVKLAKSSQDAKDIANKLIGTNLVTYQTDAKGQLVNAVYVSEDIYPVEKEYYLGLVIDRSNNCITLMASTEGGVEIEQVAHDTPEKIIKHRIDPFIGLSECHAREVAFKLMLPELAIKNFIKIVLGVYRAFIENDFALLEINPLALKTNGEMICVDAKIVIDSSALYKHKNILDLRDISQEDPRELEASKFDLNYISLDGNIGCMVNGAGLAMATMDIIKLYGANPANFLDVGGGATKERVMEALRIILQDSNVKAVLINIFGGIVRCDMIAEAIVEAVKEVSVNVPVVVRLAGNNAELGYSIFAKSDLAIITADNLSDAAKKVVAQVC
jgi:succinyl-CoA synthetase beta subunit